MDTPPMICSPEKSPNRRPRGIEGPGEAHRQQAIKHASKQVTATDDGDGVVEGRLTKTFGLTVFCKGTSRIITSLKEYKMRKPMR